MARKRQEWIGLSPPQKTYNLIRGTNPQPGAYTYFYGKKVKVFDSELSNDTERGEPGQVLDISESGIKIATRDGAILVKRVQPESMPKMESIRYAKLVRLKVGTVLGMQSEEVK